MTTRWNPTVPSGQPPEPTQPKWKRFVLPGAGAAALLLVVVIVALVATGGDDDEQDDTDMAEDSGAIATATAEAEAALQQVTPTPDPTDELVPLTPEPSPTVEVDPEPTPTPTPVQVAEEPPPTPTPVPEEPAPAASRPVTGEFGELPAGDMPSGSPADALNLQFNLDMGLQAVPSEALAYRINRRQWSLQDAQNVATNLGIGAEVVDQGGGSFQAEGGSASLYINPSSIQYVRPSSTDSPPQIPGNDQLVATARNWLVDNGLVTGNVGFGEVRNRNEQTGVANVLISPAEPSNIISGTPSARVSVRGDGVVTEATISWFQSLGGSTYGLRPAEDLWADATSGRGFVDIRANDLPAGFQGASATANITSVSIAYTVAGSPQGTQYLVPVVVFSGSANVEGTSVPVSIYVQAAAAQAIPRG